MFRTSWCLTMCTVVMLLPAAALAANATVAPGDRISGTLSSGDSDTLSFFVGSPSSLDLKAKLGTDLRIGFTVVGPDGGELDAAGALKKGLTRKPSLRKLPLTQVGTYRLVIEQSAGEGDYNLQHVVWNETPVTPVTAEWATLT